MNARAQAQCTPSCARYRSPFSLEGMAKGVSEPFCAAFPGGIPADIWENRFDHRQPHEGDHGLQWQSADSLAFPVYALAMTETLTAAADVHDGAMIALVPSQADLIRLAISGGEPADQLHLTLLFLGDAIEIDQVVRDELITWARDFVEGWDPIQTEGFAPSVFNPNGGADGDREPCLVLICSGADLAEMHETVLADVSDSLDLPDQHEPFIPHVTLMYFSQVVDGHFLSGAASTDLAAVFDRAGPIIFDTLRLAFGGEVTDIPLRSSGEVPPVADSPEAETPRVDPVAIEAHTPVMATGSTREIWDGPLHGI